MRKNYFAFALTFGLLFTWVIPSAVSAQSTFDDIVTIFTTKCSGSDCHTTNSAPVNGGVVLLDTLAAIAYQNIINTSPNIDSSRVWGYKIVVPYKPDSSMLVRKLNCNRTAVISGVFIPPMVVDEGDCMPNQTPLTHPDTTLLLSTAEVNMIFNWISCGAKDTGVVTGPCLTGIHDKYLASTDLEISPNPFSNSFNVKYRLDKSGQVKLTLLNILGEELAVLKDENQAPGNYQFEFKNLEEVESAGIYILKLNLNNSWTTQKIIRLN